jgi:hypothetical protein
MAMFSRRSLQKMLDHLAAHLPLSAREKLVHELNRPSTSALGFEWETVLLFALSHVGVIQYEAPSRSGARPDITFVEAAKSSLCFIADIATVSDHGLQAENPVTRFSQELNRLQRKYNLSGSTHYKIEGEALGRHFRDRKMQLKLPKGSEIGKFLKKNVEPMFQRIQMDKLPSATIEIKEPGVELTVRYDENQRYAGGQYPSFTAAYSLTRNPVYTSLKAKAQQFRKSGAEYPFGIFLCDGDCALLKNTRNYLEALSIDQVIGEFFRQNTSVSFVVIAVFPPTSAEIFKGIVKGLRLKCRVYVHPQAKIPIDLSALFNLLNSGLAHLPRPTATPSDALYWIANGDANEGEPIHELVQGSGLMTQSLKVSSRKIQELLAGKMTPGQFCAEYARPGSPHENPFLSALKRGLTIESVNITRLPDVDDDLMEFHFGPPDPAIRKLVVAKK